MKINVATIENIRNYVGVISIALFFITATVVAQVYQEELQAIVPLQGSVGMFVYVLITTSATVLAPVSALPLMPLAVGVWGWFITGALSVLGWVLGSQIAFALARKYGRWLVQKVVSLEKIAQYEKKFPEENIFWTVVLLRMTIPVDILSYALGLFSTISHKAFFFSTLLGVTPFAFILAYAGSLSFTFQILIALAILVVLILFYFVKKNKN